MPTGLSKKKKAKLISPPVYQKIAKTNSSPDYQKKDVITIMATKKKPKDNMKKITKESKKNLKRKYKKTNTKKNTF